MKYELILTSERAALATNAIFETDIDIQQGDRVCGFPITTKNIILNLDGSVDRIVLENYDYYRTNNQRMKINLEK